MENNLQDFYLIDLSYALSPADIVYELSTILEQEPAHNQKIYLKLGDVDLNQSQLLSIKSLICSINSSLSAISSESKQTELAAATIGLNVTEKEKEEPSAQYIPMTEHLPVSDLTDKSDEVSTIQGGSCDEVLSDKIDSDLEAIDKQNELEKVIYNPECIKNSSESVLDSDIVSDKEELEAFVSEAIDSVIASSSGKLELSDNVDNELGSETVDANNTKADISVNDIYIDPDVVDECPAGEPAVDDIVDVSADVVDDESDSIELQKPVASTTLENEEIQAQLDSIFNSETKLENILAEQDNYPLAQEAANIEIPEEEELTEEDYQILKMPTRYVKQTIRSGQVIKFDGNIIVIGDCHPGSELYAAGDITVWGTLGGIAHAGSEGNLKARIRALQLNAIQLRIGEFYARRPDALNVAYIDKSNSVTPEEARIINDNIVILKLTD